MSVSFLWDYNLFDVVDVREQSEIDTLGVVSNLIQSLYCRYFTLLHSIFRPDRERVYCVSDN